MKKNIRKIAYFLLSLTVAAAMLLGTATTAFAADTPIAEVEITIDIPLVGDTNTTVVFSESSDKYDITIGGDAKWQAYGMYSAEMICKDTDYNTPVFTVTAAAGYALDSNTVVVVNGMQENVNYLGGEIPARQFDFLTLPTLLGDVGDVVLSNVPTAVVGEAPAPYSYTNTTDHYSVTSTWEKYDYTQKQFNPMQSTDVFEEGNIYRQYFTVTTELGYALSDGCYAYVNGGEGIYLGGASGISSFEITYSLATEITEVYIDTSKFPKATVGKNFEYDGTNAISVPTDANANYTIEGYWEEEGTWETNGTFEEGKAYSFYYTVYPKEGYSFAELIEYYEDGQCMGGFGTDVIRFNFDTRVSYKKALNEVIVSDVPKAEKGKKIKGGEIELKVPSGAKYTAVGYWDIYDSVSDYSETTEQDVTVEDGKIYTFIIRIIPADGYEFSEDTILTVNGITRRPNNVNYDSIYHECRYSFLKVIEKVEIIGFKEAKIGEAPDISGVKVPDGAGYEITDIGWCDTSTGEEVQKFEDGKEYGFSVTVFAKPGYEFAADAKRYLNGEEQEYGYVFDMDAYISHSISFKEQLDEIKIDSIPEFKVGAESSNEVKVPKGAKYSAAAEWNVWNDESETYDFFDGKFESGKIYSLHMYIIPNEGYQFAEDAVAYLDGEELSNIDIMPDFAMYYKNYSDGLKVIDVIEITVEKPKKNYHTSIPPVITVPEDAPYTVNDGASWLIGTIEDYEWLEDYVFDGADNCGVSISVMSKEGYVFAENPLVVINGCVMSGEEYENLTAKENYLSYFFGTECSHHFDDASDIKCDYCGFEKEVEKEEEKEEIKEEAKPADKIPPTGENTLPLSVAVIVALCSVLYLSKNKTQKV